MTNFWNIVKVDAIGLLGINKILHNKKARKKSIGMAFLFLYIGICVISSSCFYINSIALTFSTVNATHLTATFALTASGFLVLISCLSKASSILFKDKNYDVVSSLPVKTNTIVATKLFSLYMMNLLFVLIIMVPCFIFYSIYEGFSTLILIKYLITLPLVPVAPLILGSIISVVFSVFSSKFKCSVIVNSFFNFIFIILIFVLSSTSSSMFSGENELMVDSAVLEMGNMLSKFFPISSFYTNGVFQNNVLELIYFILISLVLVFSYVFVVSKKYKSICNILSIKFTKGNFKVSSQKSTSVLKALYKKEVKRFFSSTTYIVNIGFGCVLLIVASVATLFFDTSSIPEDADFIFSKIGWAIPYAISFFSSTICTTCSSISIEGNHFWILKTLPIKTSDIFKSKILFNLSLSLPTIIFANIFFTIGLKLTFLQLILSLFTTISFALFIAVLGLFLNTKFYRLDFKNEAVVIKQGFATLLTILLPMIPNILLIFIAISLPLNVLFILPLINLFVLLITFILYRKTIKTNINKIY